MLTVLTSDTLCKTGMKQVAASKSQPGSSKQGPPEAPEAAPEPEDGGKKRKWRYFWAEEEHGA